jgi:hypothetical protein
MVRVALRPLVTALMCTVRAFLLQHPNLKIGPNFRGPSPTTMLQGVHADPPSLYLWAFGVIRGRQQT